MTGKLLGEYGVQWHGVHFSHLHNNFHYKFNLMRFIMDVGLYSLRRNQANPTTLINWKS